MAISSIGSFPPTMEEFIAHWTEVNAAISPAVLTLKNAFTLANFTTERTDIIDSFPVVEAADNVRQGAAGDRDIKKAAIRPRLGQLRAAVTGVLSGTKYARMLPKMPPFGAAESKFLRPFDDMASIWLAINTDTIPGFTGPLLLSGGYTLAAFNTELAALKAAFVAWVAAENGGRSARASRDVLLPPAREHMRQYRLAAKVALPPGHALLATIPALTPPPGSTPEAVVVTAIWNGTAGALSWPASTNPNLDHYDLRSAPGPTYHTADEFHVATIPANETSVTTLAGLGAPGATALYKVYVVLGTANEKGSNTVSVTRPG